MMNKDETSIRAFLAFTLPEEIKTIIHNLYGSINKNFNIKARWVALENLHLTVKFLGNISEKMRDKIIERLKSMEMKIKITLMLDSYGSFPPKSKPRVFWVSFREEEGDDQLNSIFKKIDHEMKNLSFPREKRKFTPHITIARLKIRDHSGMKEFTKMLELFKKKFDEADKKAFSVNKLTLFKSVLTPSGPIYSKIEEF